VLLTLLACHRKSGEALSFPETKYKLKAFAMQDYFTKNVAIYTIA
jgi:hypothetical protein